MAVSPKQKGHSPNSIPKAKEAYTTKPGIEIDEKGLWRYQGQTIENTNVLSYFKQQLRRNEKGYYIENIFGEKVEHAYLEKLRAFPLRVQTILPFLSPAPKEEFCLELSLDSHEKLSAPVQDLHILGTDNMALILSGRGRVPARLSPGAMASLMPCLHQDQDGDYFLVLPSVQRKQKLSLSKEEDFWQDS